VRSINLREIERGWRWSGCPSRREGRSGRVIEEGVLWSLRTVLVGVGVLKMDSLRGKWPRLTLVDSRLWDGTADVVHADLYAGVAPS
jgi:hypothetical protein